ncbi:MAG: metallophosphoesterase [Oscillospiraceae bacterium]|nr:metallophosphoesterase [Oscillospiraceae bacterium]
MIYAIADLHLSIGTENKEMDIFGENWRDHTRKIEENWNSIVGADDTVVIAGDICWATGMENARLDLEFIHNLAGARKIILKGNHDYWWNTVTKLDNFARECGFHTLRFLHNDAIVVEDKVVCGTRGWMLEENPQNADNYKIFEREKIRLELSLEKARKLQQAEPDLCSGASEAEIVAFMHYPPVTRGSDNTDFLEIMRKFGVKRCYYGHLHGASHKSAVIGEVDGIDLRLVACDYTDFAPVPVDNK